MTRHIADVGRLGVERIREGADLVAAIDVAGAHRQERRRPVTQRNHEPILRRRPFKRRRDVLAIGDADQGAMPTGNEDRDIVVETACDHVGKLPRLLELRMILGEEALHRRVFGRHRPILELDRIARHGRHVEAETGLVEMIHRKQRLHRMVAGREEGAVVRQQIALVGADHQHLLPALVGMRIIRAAQVRFRRGELAERIA